MKLFALAGAMFALATAGGCASSTEQAQPPADGKPVYRTGSNVPAARTTGNQPGLTNIDQQTIEDLQRRPARAGGN